MTTYNPTVGIYPPGTKNSIPFSGAPFTMDKSFGIQSITDGTSNTLLMSEVKIGADITNGNQDHRGDIWNDDWMCAMFTAFTPPNVQFNDYLGNDCNYPYQNNPPCITQAPYFIAARSYHSGGVNCADGGRPRAVLQEFGQPQHLGLPGSSQGGEVIARLLVAWISTERNPVRNQRYASIREPIELMIT